jgi:hypothetical protein
LGFATLSDACFTDGQVFGGEALSNKPIEPRWRSREPRAMPDASNRIRDALPQTRAELGL